MADDWRASVEKLGLNPVSMPLVTEVPDGGRIEVTEADIVPMGDVHAHRQLTYSHDGDANRPACKIVFEVRRGVPICTSIHLWSQDQNPVRAKDLNAVKLDNLRDDVYATAGVFTRNPEGGWIRRIGLRTFQEDRKRVERATQRRKVTPEFLSRVADIHNDAAFGGRIETIRAAFDVSERQALRYIALAKGKGLIDG